MLPVSMQMYVTGVSYGYQLRMSVAGDIGDDHNPHVLLQQVSVTGSGPVIGV